MDRRIMTGLIALLAIALSAAATVDPKAAVLAVLVAGLATSLVVLGVERTGVALLCAAFATAPFYRGLGIGGDVATPTDVAMIGGIGILLLGSLERKLDLPVPYLVSLAVLPVFAVIGSLNNPTPGASLVFVAQWMLMLALIPLAIALWGPQRRTVNLLLWCYLAGQTLSCLWAVAEGAAVNDRYDGLSHHANSFGAAAVVAFAICLYLFHEHSRRVRVVLLGVAALSLLGVVLSGGRAVTVTALALIVLVPIVERSAILVSGGVLLAALGAAFLPLAIAASPEGSSLQRLAGDGTTRYSDSVREGGLDKGWDRFYDSPFLGSGLDVDVGVLHNVYLEVAVSVGVFGFVAYVVVLTMLGRPLLGHHPMRRLAYVTVAFALIGVSYPGVADRSVLLPMALGVLAMVAPRPDPAADDPASDVRAATSRGPGGPAVRSTGA